MEYEVIRSARKTLAVEVKQGWLIVRAPTRASDAQIRAFLDKHRRWIEDHLAQSKARQAEAEAVPKLAEPELRALAERAMQVVPQRVAYYAPLVGVTYGKITIRNQHARWGSCSSKGNLSFNCLLMLAPPGDEPLRALLRASAARVPGVSEVERMAERAWPRAAGSQSMR